MKQEYTSELKEKEAFGQLMPLLCAILNVGQRGAQKPFDLTHWNITEYDCQGFDGYHEMSFFVLASHLYYRSLRSIPSLVRLWWIDCKHRQLTLAVESYTEKYFSQPIIDDELEMVNRPDIKSQLEENEENEFTIKTLKAASEVTAKYVVDEQDMQIAIKLPSNYPLRQIEVEGVQKVGVNDKQWRGWMFAITAVIGSQNGNIVDALTVFKRNVNLHFSGVEDCTICYSIISPQDRTIPTKQCRTCKKKFHSSCLYKVKEQIITIVFIVIIDTFDYSGLDLLIQLVVHYVELYFKLMLFSFPFPFWLQQVPPLHHQVVVELH